MALPANGGDQTARRAPQAPAPCAACEQQSSAPQRRATAIRRGLQVSKATLVTGGSGYIGALLVQELLGAGREVRVLDSLLHGQEDIAAEQERAGVEVIRADIRDEEARRRALTGAEAVVLLAAIVGDPACALDPKVSDDVNVQATRALVDDANEAGGERLRFAPPLSDFRA